jgi:predicted alpha/beta superfamily hydrolase
MKRAPRFPLVLLSLLLTAPVLAAGGVDQGLVPVRFEVQQATRWGESVYLAGDLPALGGGELTRAPRMLYGQGGTWSLTVALPPGASYRYRYVVRDNDPQAMADPGNGRDVSAVQSGQVPGVGGRQVTVRYRSGWSQPVLHYLRADGDVGQATLQQVGPGRGPGESTWEATVTTLRATLTFVVADGNGAVDRPPSGGAYDTGLAAFTLSDGQVEAAGVSPGAGRVLVVDGWYSHHTQNARPIHVYLPPGYDQHPGHRYPVLYMHDGQNLFGPDALFGGWRVERALDRLIAAGQVEPLIVIGVGNTGARMREYIPEADGGEASRYARFLIDELKPWVDASWRTLPGREHTGTCGSSLGGLVSTYLAWEHPDVFARAGSLSGSFWLRGWVGELERSNDRPDLRLWLDSGNEGPSADSLENTLHVRDILLRKGLVLGRDVNHLVDHGQRHNEAAWRGRVDRVLAWLFPPR